MLLTILAFPGQVSAECCSDAECSGGKCIGDGPGCPAINTGYCQQHPGCGGGIVCPDPCSCVGDICINQNNPSQGCSGGGGGGGWQYTGNLCSDFGLEQSCYDAAGYCSTRGQCVPLTSNYRYSTTGCKMDHGGAGTQRETSAAQRLRGKHRAELF